MRIVKISVVRDFSALVLAEPVLSYVSVGVDRARQSAENMINAAGLEMAREPVVRKWLAGGFLRMSVAVLCAYLLAAAVRDAVDPRLRKSRW